jgi:ribose transport system ATP-binding protein
VISSDVEEVLGLAHRIYVIRHGRVAAELTGTDMSEENILTAAFAENGRSPDIQTTANTAKKVNK